MLKAVICDIDGTITDERRRISTTAIETLRLLIGKGIPVVLASGNTLCFLDSIARMIGTDGAVIGENGGVFQTGFDGKPQITGDRSLCLHAYDRLVTHFKEQGITLLPYSMELRYADVAFARTVPVDEVVSVIADLPVRVIDTGYAIHLQTPGISKGSALAALAPLLSLTPKDFLALGDSDNDLEMLEIAGFGITLANGSKKLKKIADLITDQSYGEGFSEGLLSALERF
ncbi:MAG: Phosphoglycolate phosphatase [Methanomicrobiales archaeon 53_19]|uniref:phosphoglycolate phosphatase n=1 Tax=Methanocalculus sp. TaxID=2004547 RepID=UPI00074A3C09|nr:phosphoglycolate phosphatase [Methanocalculus sp.]KUK70620.1 MAG: Phosphoglycolate phosphatase [Methanocalculus sp. 52_23]KUL03510.1 MAG: Phosphoglycolate phosphatase [Methanomicrobiales archaeon 53_19]HIJ06730.1 phosphoglycolate phosphatase [Methanocalculus sp.]